MDSSASGPSASARQAWGRSLRERGPRFRRLLETTKAIPWEADARTLRFTYVGPQAVTLLGYPLDDWYEPGFWASHIHREDRQRTVRYCMECAQRRKHYEFEYRMWAADGRAVWLHDIVNVEYAGGEAALLTGFMIDVGGRRCAANEHRRLVGQFLCAHEEERRRLARELRDDLTQRLAALTLQAGRIEHRLDALGTSALDDVRSIRGELGELTADIQRMARRLRPSILDDLGLVTALECECGRLQQRSGVTVLFAPGEVPEALPAEVALCLYRVAQEGLRNVVKHAGAGQVELALGTESGKVVLKVRDNGGGFDRERARGRTALGLAGMEERVHHVGGELFVRSAPGRGTEVEAWVPLDLV